MKPELWWGAYILPLPDEEGISVSHPPIGSTRQMLNGYLRGQVTAIGTRVKILWPGLTNGERNILWTAFQANYAQEASLQLPDGQHWTVIVGTNSWEESHWWARGEGGQWFYTVTITFESSVPG
jgi:hypothetical protein